MISETFQKYIAFVFEPNEKREIEKPFIEKLKVLFHLYLINWPFIIVAGSIIALVSHYKIVNVGENDISKMFEKFKPWQIFLMASVAAPLLEEALFRAPLVFKNNYLGKFFLKIVNGVGANKFYNGIKNNRRLYFKCFFYVLTFTFAIIHFSNFAKSANQWLWAPIFTLPQLFIGFTLGYIRIKFGFWWGVAYHAFHNFVMLSLSFTGMENKLDLKKPHLKQEIIKEKINSTKTKVVENFKFIKGNL